LDRALRRGAADHWFHALLRKREPGCAGFNDGRAFASRDFGPRRHHLARPPIHRAGLHPRRCALRGARGIWQTARLAPSRLVQNASRPPTTASVPASSGRRMRSGTREAKWLEIIMPGIEPTRSERSIWKSTEPSPQCPAPAIRVSGTAWAMTEPTMRTIGDFG